VAPCAAAAAAASSAVSSLGGAVAGRAPLVVRAAVRDDSEHVAAYVEIKH